MKIYFAILLLLLTGADRLLAEVNTKPILNKGILVCPFQGYSPPAWEDAIVCDLKHVAGAVEQQTFTSMKELHSQGWRLISVVPVRFYDSKVEMIHYFEKD